MNDLKCVFSIYPNLQGIRKNGTFKNYYSYIEMNTYDINCLIKNIILFINVKEDNLKYSNKKIPHKRLRNMQLYILGKLDFKYSIYKKNIDNVNEYIFYKKNNYNDILLYIYILNKYKYNFINKNKDFIKKMAIEYYLFKIKFKNNISDNEFFIAIFFNFYIKQIKDEIIKKYGMDITYDFKNYHEIYIFLKKKNYINKFYTTIKKNIITEYNRIKKKISLELEQNNSIINLIKTHLIQFSLKNKLNKKNFSKQDIEYINKILNKIKNNEK